MYSSIKIKSCKHEGCTYPPKLGYMGYCGWNHLPDELKEEIGNKRNVQIKRQNAVKYASVKLRQTKYKENTEQELWFRARRLEMDGYCICGCGQKSSKDSDKYYKFSLAHVLKKSEFKSIATHVANCIELAAFGDSCHTTFDNMGYEYCKDTKPKLWAIVVEKFKILYPCIAEDEKKKIPQVLLNELKSQIPNTI